MVASFCMIRRPDSTLGNMCHLSGVTAGYCGGVTAKAKHVNSSAGVAFHRTEATNILKTKDRVPVPNPIRTHFRLRSNKANFVGGKQVGVAGKWQVYEVSHPNTSFAGTEQVGQRVGQEKGKVHRFFRYEPKSVLITIEILGWVLVRTHSSHCVMESETEN